MANFTPIGVDEGTGSDIAAVTPPANGQGKIQVVVLGSISDGDVLVAPDANGLPVQGAGTAGTPAGGVSSIQGVPAGVVVGVQEQGGTEIARSDSTTATSAAADTSFTWAAAVKQVELHNKATQGVYYEVNGAATVGSRLLPPARNGQPSVVRLAGSITSIHLYTASAVNVNGSSDGNIVLKGYR